MHWRQYLRIQTQHPPFLWRMVLIILGAGLAIGYVVQSVSASRGPTGAAQISMAAAGGENELAMSLFEKMLADENLAFEKVLETVNRLAKLQKRLGDLADEVQTPGMGRVKALPLDPKEVLNRISASSLADSQQQIARTLWSSTLAGQATPQLLEAAGAKQPVRFASHALGLLLESFNRDGLAATAYEREGAFPDAVASRERAVRIYVRLDETAELQRLARQPAYAELVPTVARIQMAASVQDWATVFKLIPRAELERFSLGPALLALFTGLCWFLFAIQAGQVDERRGARWWLCVLAVPLGVLSVWPTMFLITYQETVWGLVDAKDIGGGLRFYVFGVGFREELSKLLLLLPLFPFLVRRRNELEVLIVASCVGLGFAMLENEHYFSATFGSSTLGRFLTANFFHMAATGLVGLALVRGIWDPKNRAPESIAVFGVIVLAHGLYDSAIALPAFQEYSILSSIIFILLAYQYFHELRSMRGQRHETVSLTANFLCGVSSLTAVTFIYLAAQFDFRLAMAMLAPEALSMVLMAYMFLREIPNSLLRTN